MLAQIGILLDKSFPGSLLLRHGVSDTRGDVFLKIHLGSIARNINQIIAGAAVAVQVTGKRVAGGTGIKSEGVGGIVASAFPKDRQSCSAKLEIFLAIGGCRK